MIRGPWLVIFTSLLLFIRVLENLILSGKQDIFKTRCTHWGNSCFYRLNTTCGNGIWKLQNSIVLYLFLIELDICNVYSLLIEYGNGIYTSLKMHTLHLDEGAAVSSSEEIESVILIQFRRFWGWQSSLLSQPRLVYAFHCTTQHNEVKNHRKLLCDFQTCETHLADTRTEEEEETTLEGNQVSWLDM